MTAFFSKPVRPGNSLMPALLVCLAGVILLSGCSRTQPMTETGLPADLPDTWSTKAVKVAPEDLPIAAGLLDLITDQGLRKLVGEALDNNPDLLATALRLEAAGYFLSGPRSRRMPGVRTEFSKGRDNQTPDALTGDPTTTDSHRLSLGVGWEIDIWGRLADEHAAAKGALYAQEMDYLHARDALAVRVIQAWIEQTAHRRSLAIETERVDILQRIENLLIQRYQHGIGDPDELSAARSRSEIARADLSQRKAALNRSVRRLEVLLGRYPRGKLLAGEELPAVARPTRDLPAAVLLNRPDVQSALARVEAARKTATAARKAMLPNARLSGQLFKNSAHLGDLGAATSYWSILGALFQPLFEGGRLMDESRARRSEAESALLGLHKVVLQALKEVEDALDLEGELAEQARALHIGARESEKSYRYYYQRYLQGLDSIQSPLAAKEQEMAVKVRLNEIEANRLSNRIDLCLALGVGVMDATR